MTPALWISVASWAVWGASPAFAAESSAAPEPSVNARVTLTWINAVSLSELNHHPANTDNTTLHLPHLLGVSEVRPEFKAEAGDFHLVVRPTAKYRPARAVVNGVSVDTWDDSDFYFNEANIQWVLSDSLAVAYGLQNFQWGPAESFSPSNRIFHDPVLVRDLLFEYRGRHLVRLNLSAGSSWSFVLLGEPTTNGEAPFVEGDAFDPKAALKMEYSTSGGASYGGLVLGARKDAGSWLGEYFNLTLSEGFTIYADLSHERGSQAWYPIETTDPGSSQSIVDLSQTHSGDGNLYTLAVAGARYTFSNGNDLRLEYIFDQQGYSLRERSLLQQAALATTAPQISANVANAPRLLHPGLEFPGQHFIFGSLRVPEFLVRKNLSFYTRYMHSLTDHSGNSFSALELAIGGSGTAFAAVEFTHGDPLDELGGFVASTYMLGYRHVW